MKTWRAVAMAGASLLLFACQQDDSGSSSSEPGSTSASEPGSELATGDPWAALRVPLAAYQEWQPVLHDVGPWTADGAAAIATRVSDASARDYTAAMSLAELPVVLAHTADRDRVRVVVDDAWVVEVHVEPGPATVFGLDKTSVVVCLPGSKNGQGSKAEAQCVRVDRGEKAGAAPHLFNNFIDSFAFASVVLAASQSPEALPGPDAERPTPADQLALGVVDSPAGPLECLVMLPGGAGPDDLDGAQISLQSPMETGGVGLSAFCVDRRGLVIVSPGVLTSLNALTDFEPGVAPGTNRYPAEPTPYKGD